MPLSRILLAFVAGFVATLVFHQTALTVVWTAGLTGFAPFPMAPTWPFGVPKLFSLAFWGGVWGIVMMALIRRLTGSHYWLAALVFGAIAPTLVVWFVVLPLNGLPVGGGWRPAGIATGLIVNGAWGVGTAILYRGMRFAGPAEIESR
ncbi:MAG: hypothetical protein R3202_13725 [Candidatus Competibacterales bacterium]|nr:hypothetical protein [Candidatus Competibacterales bacterium]